MNRREIAMGTGLAALLGVAKTGNAQGGGGRTIEGSWRVTITTGPGAPPNQPATGETFITYAAGGTTLEFNGQPGSTPAHGVWRYSGSDEFAGTWFRYVYDAQGAIQLVNKVRARIRMVSDNEYSNEVRVDIYGPSGQVIASWANTSVGRRIVVETID